MYVITGGSSGIGRSLARALAKRKKSVCIIGRRADFLEKVGQPYCVADITKEEDLKKIQTLLANHSIEGLIHNAGIIDPIEKITHIAPDAWENIIKSNLFAPFRLTQLLLPQLSGGRVLHIGSGAAYFPVVGWSAYCVSKAALAMLTRCYQAELTDPVFSSVMPGIVNTAMTASIRSASAAMEPKQLTFHQTLYQQGRLVEPETVALFLSWLLLDLDRADFASKEWDIYDMSHHEHWLKAPHQVPLI